MDVVRVIKICFVNSFGKHMSWSEKKVIIIEQLPTRDSGRQEQQKTCGLLILYYIIGI